MQSNAHWHASAKKTEHTASQRAACAASRPIASKSDTTVTASVALRINARIILNGPACSDRMKSSVFAKTSLVSGGPE